MEKKAGTGSFHKIHTETVSCQEGEVLIVRKLGDLLGFSFDVTKKRMNVSDEICRRCMKSVKETLHKDEELKASKAELLATFFSTTSKFSRQVAASEAAEEDHLHLKEEQGGAGGGGRASAAAAAQQSHRHHHQHHQAGGPVQPDLYLHRLAGLYGLPENYRLQQQHLLLQKLPSSDMSEKSSGYGLPVLLPYYKTHPGEGGGAAGGGSSGYKSGAGAGTGGRAGRGGPHSVDFYSRESSPATVVEHRGDNAHSSGGNIYFQGSSSD
jgi:hypothetical protein